MHCKVATIRESDSKSQHCLIAAPLGGYIRKVCGAGCLDDAEAEVLAHARPVFSTGFATFVIVMVLAGRQQARAGPTLVYYVADGIMLGASYIFGGLEQLPNLGQTR